MPIHWLTEAEIVRLTSYPAEISEADIVTFFTLSRRDRKQLVGSV